MSKEAAENNTSNMLCLFVEQMQRIELIAVLATKPQKLSSDKENTFTHLWAIYTHLNNWSCEFGNICSFEWL